MELEKRRVKAEAASDDVEEEEEAEVAKGVANRLWADLQFNLDVSIPPYLVNLLTLMGFDNALSLKLMTSEDVDHVEQMVQGGIRDLVDEDRLADYVGVYRKHPDKFRILPGHRKILDSIIHLLNQLDSYGAAQVGEPTSSSSSAGWAGAQWGQGGSSDPDVEIVVEPETTQHALLPLLAGKRKSSSSSECEMGFDRGKQQTKTVKRKCAGPEVSVEEPARLPELRELLYDILKRWIDQSQAFFETPFTIASVNISLDRQRALGPEGGALGEPTAVVTCLVCRSTVRIQCLPCRYKPGPTRRWVISNFQRHVKRAHFKPEFRPPPDVSTSSSAPHVISFNKIH